MKTSRQTLLNYIKDFLSFRTEHAKDDSGIDLLFEQWYIARVSNGEKDPDCFPTIDKSTWFYENCKSQRKRKAKICQSCPFRLGIERQEAKPKKECKSKKSPDGKHRLMTSDPLDGFACEYCGMELYPPL